MKPLALSPFLRIGALIWACGLTQAQAQAPVPAPPAGGPTQAAASTRVATFKQLQGNVSAGPLGALRRAFVVQGLNPKDRIITDEGAQAALVFRDGTVLSIGPMSWVDVPAAQFEPTTQNGVLVVGVVQGTVRLVTGWLGKTHPDQVRVVTPTSVVGVRGTDFVVEVP